MTLITEKSIQRIDFKINSESIQNRKNTIMELKVKIIIETDIGFFHNNSE